MKKVFLMAVVVQAVASCSLQKQTTNTAKTLGIYGAGVIQKPVLTDLKINPQKFTCTYTGNGAQEIDYHKSQAIAKAMIENHADVIIEPAYEITSSVTNISIVVTGYGGRYENFRQLTGADTSILVETGIINYNNGPGKMPAPQPLKKKGKGGWVLLGVLVIGLAAAGAAL